MKRLIFLLLTCFWCGILFSQNNASTSLSRHSDSLQLLQEVVVTARTAPVSYRATAAVQTLSATDWQRAGALQVADAAKFFAGAQVKDYGGVGGLKTVSVRGLGANYTAVVYDGIAVSDNQTGQIDLGRFSLANLGKIRLAIGESDDIFQPARNQALGATLFLQTSSPLPVSPRSTRNIPEQEEMASQARNDIGIETSLGAGSFGFVNQSAKITKSFGENYAFDVSGEYLQTDGDYSYTLTNPISGHTESADRINSDVDNKQAEANFYAHFPNSGRLRVKAYIYHSERGIPGAVIKDNLSSSTERVEDNSRFVQAHYEQPLAKRWQIQSFMKISGTEMNLNERAKLRLSDYAQQEYFGSVGLRFRATDRWSFAWVNDVLHGAFSARFSTIKDNAVIPIQGQDVDAGRNTWLSALGAVYETRRITAVARLLSQIADNIHDKQHISPYLGVSLQPVYALPLRLRAFYKNTFRQPTFGDIYFPLVPNMKLRAENAHQYNVGVTFFWQRNAGKPSFSLSADGYYNKVENKIVAFPLGSMAVWTVQNYGEALIRGIDVSGNLRLPFAENYALSLTANYSYQRVEDRSEGSTYYGSHLPYTPNHVGSGIAQISSPFLDVAYSLIFSGARYYNQSDLPAYRLPSYTDQHLTVSRTFHFNKQEIRLAAECANLLDTQYEVVWRYPMPGRSFRVIFDYKF